MKEHDTTVDDKVLNGMCLITGIIREPVEVGDIFLIGIPPKLSEYTIEEISFKDSKGVFNNTDDATNALFTADCSFSRQINV